MDVAAQRSAIMLWLIECGETEWALQGRIQGSADLPLSEAGRRAVDAELHRAEGANVAVVHHAPDEAAATTADLCAQRIKARTRAVVELADPHLGVLEGISEQEFAERFPKRHRQWEDDLVSLAPPEGEEIAEAAGRILRATARILKRSRSSEVALVLHTIGLGALRCWLADRSLHELRSMFAGRPRIERYAMPLEMISSLQSMADRANSTRVSA